MSQLAPVVANILHRAERLRRGDTTPDGRKLALVIEGGGMRSAYSGAGAAALGQLGLHEVFDEVYATSAGVMNASYFLTNQPQLGMSVYFENCTTRSFLNPVRFWKILNVDYIIDTVAACEKRLDVDRLRQSKSHLLVSVCEQDSGELALVDTRTTRTPLLQVMKAAMAIPVFYNRVVEVDGKRCIDSGTLLPFPLRQAIDRNCTDILVLLTRPCSFVESRPSRFQQCVFNSVHAFGKRPLIRAYSERHLQAQHVRDMALGRVDCPAGVNIGAVFPDEGERLEGTTTDLKITRAAAIKYGQKTLATFGHRPDQFIL